MLNPGTKPKIAFVIHRYGKEIVGGAEFQCRSYAESLTQWCDVTVLTSCASSYLTWENDIPPGESFVNGVRVIRFPSSCQRHPQHNRWWDIWKTRKRTIQDECRWIYEQGPVLPDLLAFLSRSHELFNVFIFFTYLYYPTVMGLPLVADKAILVPTAPPNEIEILMIYFKRLLNLPRLLIYCTPEEKDWIQQVSGNTNIPYAITAIPIEKIERYNSMLLEVKYGVNRPYLLFLGRIGTNKGCDRLLEYYQKYVENTSEPLSLVLAGDLEMTLPQIPGLIHVGAVFGEDLRELLSNAFALVNPSRLDNLSIAVCEAWAAGIPVLANASSPVVKALCHRSQGGLVWGNAEEFSGCIKQLAMNPNLAIKMGQSGQSYILSTYGTQKVEATLRAGINYVLNLSS
jgi:glycosyltransferase involved in cell wall biosynthesis